MERGSKHNPRLDEQMRHETEGLVRAGHDTHAQEWKSAEPSGEDEPDVDLAPSSTLSGGTPPGMTEGEVEGRSELARFLHRSSFPAVREVLIDDAMKNDAPTAIVDLVKRLPAGREFENVAAVWSALGGHNEEHRV